VFCQGSLSLFVLFKQPRECCEIRAVYANREALSEGYAAGCATAVSIAYKEQLGPPDR
jgi:hypothetical protein